MTLFITVIVDVPVAGEDERGDVGEVIVSVMILITPVCLIVITVPTLNEPFPLIFAPPITPFKSTNGPATKSQLPFWLPIVPSDAGPATIVLVEVKTPVVPSKGVVIVKVKGVPTVTPELATLQIFSGAGTNVVLAYSASFVSV
jgi:hypothetical protein